MSEVMTRGIIGMPFEMAMGDDLSRRQFHSRAQGLLADCARLEQECEVLTAQRAAAYDSIEGLTQLVGQTQDERDAAIMQVEMLSAYIRRALIACKNPSRPRQHIGEILDAALSAKPAAGGCGSKLAPGQYWSFCGETDMGQSMPALCDQCGGSFKLDLP